MPDDRVAILRAAFDATVKDPQFLAEARKLLVDISPRSASEATAIVDDIHSMPDGVVKLAREIISD